jgi:hypothetical protein
MQERERERERESSNSLLGRELEAMSEARCKRKRERERERERERDVKLLLGKELMSEARCATATIGGSSSCQSVQRLLARLSIPMSWRLTKPRSTRAHNSQALSLTQPKRLA